MRILDESVYGTLLDDAWMLTMPSYCGFEGINPLTVYFCYSRTRGDKLYAVVLEVRPVNSPTTSQRNRLCLDTQYFWRASYSCPPTWC